MDCILLSWFCLNAFYSIFQVLFYIRKTYYYFLELLFLISGITNTFGSLYCIFLKLNVRLIKFNYTWYVGFINLVLLVIWCYLCLNYVFWEQKHKINVCYFSSMIFSLSLCHHKKAEICQFKRTLPKIWKFETIKVLVLLSHLLWELIYHKLKKHFLVWFYWLLGSSLLS